AYFDSDVDWHAVNIYDLAPEKIGGAVDLAFVGSLLLHLRDPVGGLERVRECLGPGGRLVLFETVEDEPKRRKPAAASARFMAHETLWTWWYPNAACVRAWAETA